MPIKTGNKQSAFQATSSAIVEYVRENVKADDSGCVYQHQKDAVDFVVRRHTEQQPFALVSVPTGAGKSGIAVLCAYFLNCSRILVVTPNHDLSKQFKREIRGKPKGSTNQWPFLLSRDIVFAEDDAWVPTIRIVDKAYELKPDLDLQQYAVVIANRHKWGSKKAALKEFGEKSFDLVIIDEAHQLPAETILNVYKQFHNKNVFILLLTATPFRTGTKPLIPVELVSEQEFKDGKWHFTLAEAVKRKIIREVAPVVFVNTVEDVTRNLVVKFVEKSDAQINVESDNEDDSEEEENNDSDQQLSIVNTVDYLCDNVAIVLAAVKQLQLDDAGQPNVKHLAMIVFPNTATCQKFVDFWPTLQKNNASLTTFGCKSYYGKEPRNVVDEFKKGSFRVLCVVFKLLEGFDEKKISVVGMASKTRSPVRYSQIIGRAIRRYGGKADPTKATVVALEKHKDHINAMHTKYLNEQFALSATKKSIPSTSSSTVATSSTSSTQTTRKRLSDNMEFASKKPKGSEVKRRNDNDDE